MIFFVVFDYFFKIDYSFMPFLQFNGSVIDSHSLFWINGVCQLCYLFSPNRILFFVWFSLFLLACSLSFSLGLFFALFCIFLKISCFWMIFAVCNSLMNTHFFPNVLFLRSFFYYPIKNIDCKIIYLMIIFNNINI